MVSREQAETMAFSGTVTPKPVPVEVAGIEQKPRWRENQGEFVDFRGFSNDLFDTKRPL